jgi:hypothetical protein
MASRVLVSTRVAASPQRAFDVFTRRIGDWWVHNDLLRLTPRDPGVIAFREPDEDGVRRLVETRANGKEFEIGKVSVWAPGERLVVGWRQATFGPDHATEVEVKFEAVDSDTRVTVEHRGWDSVPQEHVARHGFPLTIFQQHQGAQWRDGLTRMSLIVTGEIPDD